MGKMARRRRRRQKRVQSVPRSLPTHMTGKELRDFIPRREPLRERRQFVSTIKEFDDEFTIRRAKEVPARVDGIPARHRKQLSMPKAVESNDYMREGHVSSLHDYFSERPELVAPCVHRKQRRAVLFALHRTAKGSGAGKSHVWTAESTIRCR